MNEVSLEPSDYMTMKELTELFRVTRQTVYRWTKAGKLHPINVGHRNLYRRADVIELMTESGLK